MFESARRDLSWVPRWGILRVNRRQSVAEHSFYVCSYGLEIARLIDWPSGTTGAVAGGRYGLALYLLRHDEQETLESDIPGPIKRLCRFDGEKAAKMVEARFGDKPVSTPDMVKIKKVADLMDECMYLAGEVNSGNKSVNLVLRGCRDSMIKAVEALPATDDKKIELLHVLNTAIYAELSHCKDLGDLQAADQ